MATYFWTVYSLGLRLEEGLNLQAGDVDLKPVGNGQAVLKYLAPYVYRVAITDNRIEAIDEHGVSYQVTPSGTKQPISQNVSGHAFVRSFVQHILPRGFQKIRYYGFMSANCKMQLEQALKNRAAKYATGKRSDRGPRWLR